MKPLNYRVFFSFMVCPRTVQAHLQRSRRDYL